MKIRATLTLRNAVMIEARERSRLSQKSLAEIAGVRLEYVAIIEKMQFASLPWRSRQKTPDQIVESIAGVLEVDPKAIMPDEMRSIAVQSKHIRILDMSAELLSAQESRLSLPSYEIAAQNELKDMVGALLKTLTFREREIIKLRCGFGDGIIQTYEQIGKAFNITRERVRQIEAKALSNLRVPIRLSQLKAWMYEPEIHVFEKHRHGTMPIREEEFHGMEAHHV